MTDDCQALLRAYVSCLLREVARSRSRAGSAPSEAYDKGITADKAYRKRSTYVPKEDKDEIDGWLRDMGLSESTRAR